jgi:hypothetical protein
MNGSNGSVMILSSHIRWQGVLLACGLATGLAACSSSMANKIADSMPSSVGLPEDAPQRSATPPVYPAVHDMPPVRTNATLSAEEQEKLANDLAAMKTRQDVATGATPAVVRKRTAPTAAAPRPASTSANTIY